MGSWPRSMTAPILINTTAFADVKRFPSCTHEVQLAPRMFVVEPLVALERAEAVFAAH